MVAALEVGHVGQAEVPERGGSQAGGVSFVADDDDCLGRIVHLGEPVGAGRIQAPLQNVAFDHHGPDELAITVTLSRRADIDYQSPGVQGLLELWSANAGTYLGPGDLQLLVYGGDVSCSTQD